MEHSTPATIGDTAGQPDGVHQPASGGRSIGRGPRVSGEGPGAPAAGSTGKVAAEPRQRLAEALGLSTSHISPRGKDVESKWACEVAVGGALVAVKGRKPKHRQTGGGMRGEVQGFTKNSRRRLMRKLASIDREQVDHPPIFVTLTYPGIWPSDPKRWKRDLDAWGKRLRRRYPGACAIWKLEPQKRGAPHFHLLVLGVPGIDKVWLSQTWYEVVGSEDVKHLRAGTRVETIRSWRGVMSYASKYTAKVIDDLPKGWESVGRMWGIIGRENLPISLVRFAIDRETAHKLRAFLWEIIGGPPPGWIQFADDGLTAMVEWSHAAAYLTSSWNILVGFRGKRPL